jgi:hypothetical protein
MDAVLGQVIQQGGTGNVNRVVHGVFTYDWEGIIATLRDSQGNLRRPSQYENIETPLALIVYGETATPF